MTKTPRILIFADEPMLTVDILSELEGRGFDVMPMNPGDHTNWRPLKPFDAIVFDMSGPDDASLKFVSDLLPSGPVVTLGGAFKLAQSVKSVHSLPKPVDYDRLADLLAKLTRQPLTVRNPVIDQQRDELVAG